MKATLEDILAMVAELAAEHAGMPKSVMREAITGRVEEALRNNGSNWFLDYETTSIEARDALVVAVPIVRRLYPIAAT